ncbi:MAG TPA: HlyD family efflux transporter periplasmic adaptor subunit [Rhizomicrobium sp.]|jgi:HlyD family secretion protein|nr:HlyD family efflux transporter periplasmic adaptor subunit [Rhizomicrobium sp.]
MTNPKRGFARRERVVHMVGQEPATATGGSGMDRKLKQVPRWRRYAPYAIAAVIVLGVAIWLLASTGGSVYRVPVDRVTIANVTSGPFEDFIAVRGNVAPLLTDYLTTAEGGTVRKKLVEDGAVVTAGQAIVVLSNNALELQVAAREADAAQQISGLQNTELQVEQANYSYERDLLDVQHQVRKLKATLDRDEVLRKGDALPEATYEFDKEDYAYELRLQSATIASRDAEQKVRNAQLTQLLDALARLKSNAAAAEASLDSLTIRAPMAGRLTAFDAEIGEAKAQGAVLGQIDSLDKYKLTAQVDEFYLGKIILGQDALFTIDGYDWHARIAKIYPQVANGTFKVDLKFAGTPPAGIHDGEAVDMKIELGGAARAIMLPDGPFYQDTGGNWVFVVAPDGQYATRRIVRLGRRNPQFVEVLDGLSPGERVIVSSYEAFTKMDRVEFQKPGGGSS